MMLRRALILLLPLAATAFVTPTRTISALSSAPPAGVASTSIPQQVLSRTSTSSNAALQSSNDNENESTTSRRKRKKSGLDPEMRSKLLSESIAPWRTVRLFLYASAGSGALIGGLITLSGVAAALSGARTDIDLNTEVCYAHI